MKKDKLSKPNLLDDRKYFCNFTKKDLIEASTKALRKNKLREAFSFSSILRKLFFLFKLLLICAAISFFLIAISKLPYVGDWIFKGINWILEQFKQFLKSIFS